jgi:hypothetical protein
MGLQRSRHGILRPSACVGFALIVAELGLLLGEKLLHRNRFCRNKDTGSGRFVDGEKWSEVFESLMRHQNRRGPISMPFRVVFPPFRHGIDASHTNEWKSKSG